MPSLSLYTPFESLLFLQSLAGLEKRPESFLSISDALKNHPYIRQDPNFDLSRLTPQALEELYASLIKGKEGDLLGIKSLEYQQVPSAQQDGPGTSPNKKRKVTPSGDGAPNPTVISGLVSRLYARFKELVTKEIQDEEQRYKDITNEIRRIHQEQTAPVPIPTATGVPLAPRPTSAHTSAETQRNTPLSQGSSNEPRIAQDANRPQQPNAEKYVPVPIAAVDPARQHIAATPAATQYRFENKTPQSMQPYRITQPMSQSTPVAPVNIQPAPNIAAHNLQAPSFPTSSSGSHIAPAFQNIPKAPTQPVAPQGVSAGGVRTSPPKPAMQGRMIQPWSIHSLPQQPQAPKLPSYLNTVQQTSSTPGRSHQVLQQPSNGDKIPSPLLQTPQTATLLKGQTRGSVRNTPKLAVEIRNPLNITPGPLRSDAGKPTLERRSTMPPLYTARSRTPWKKLGMLEIPKHPGSPVRPRPEDISPISDTELSPMEGTMSSSGTAQGTGMLKPDMDFLATSTRSRKLTPALRKGRSHSPLSPTAIQSRRRGRSNASLVDEMEGGTVKKELPTTPIGTEDVDTDRRSASRLTRSTINLPDEKTRKRKRTPAGAEATATEEPQVSAQHVIYTRNFPRTSAPIMHDIAAHKHASIFAKPLTERDAPGYKDLIYRPQDIKSIKSSIHQGSRAVAAVLEALNASEGDVPGTPKSNGLILKRTAELIPPKAIVNSSQLEKELIRMFANAVMFNPTPEDTIGRRFPMRSDFASRDESEASEPEEGGILNDTMEIYEDVERAISTWRAAERAVDDIGSKTATSTLRATTVEGGVEGVDDVK
ncbi:hypothetical protein LOZ12_001567 [Ophidiomyces ophidiicola]|uniref:uncharacterized protein n=1 Tax=Ophidiomyces ophidiicola TaxID=1387563 RepID=UPI0020C582CE|nr:uncharacterized protein LOZ57_002854 [Ophidiomyces ophidiicola]KAI1948499.1 hypothetical protein LOZ57_002854 [Ophidiomyces ophidiicola]KAI1953145.1 hypothetical protein LOZ62_001209 [Ophidiomyces ophidiicola]KAI2009505.1 hypothetical protein LOZ50_001562 [Ophidiomyces ophidiicola]KAI2028187.1 hypothetical protein LOZ45_002302 [Ophidiomyces ophidiicola]KAI2054816.1 hypothetical protein LOZ38_001110 [Ophidiomyces ophidiicola]